MFDSPILPNRLCIKEGVLTMKDGSSVQEYLQSRPLFVNAEEVVLFTRKEAQQLTDAATAYRLSKLTEDERFCLAA